jgi:tetratricopeptide (TPR) repeat protein
MEALNARAMATIFSGGDEGVVELSDEVVRLAESTGDWVSLGFSEAGMAQWEVERGNAEAARLRLVRATDAARRTGNPVLMAFTALSRGRVSGMSGDLDDARAWFSRAIEAYEEAGDTVLALVARSDLGHVLRAAGMIREAEAIYRRTTHEWVHTGNRGAVANQLESWAYLALRAGRHVRAARLLGAAEAIREAAESVMLSFERREYDAAVEALRRALPGDEFAEAWADGRRLSIDEAVSLALARPD